MFSAHKVYKFVQFQNVLTTVFLRSWQVQCFYYFKKELHKGTVQRKLRGVLSGINRKLMIWAWAAWG
jgi:hypothetical protein